MAFNVGQDPLAFRHYTFTECLRMAGDCLNRAALHPSEMGAANLLKAAELWQQQAELQRPDQNKAMPPETKFPGGGDDT